MEKSKRTVRLSELMSDREMHVQSNREGSYIISRVWKRTACAIYKEDFEREDLNA